MARAVGKSLPQGVTSPRAATMPPSMVRATGVVACRLSTARISASDWSVAPGACTASSGPPNRTRSASTRLTSGTKSRRSATVSRASIRPEPSRSIRAWPAPCGSRTVRANQWSLPSSTSGTAFSASSAKTSDGIGRSAGSTHRTTSGPESRATDTARRGPDRITPGGTRYRSTIVALNWRTLVNPAASATSRIGRAVLVSSSRASRARPARATSSGPQSAVSSTARSRCRGVTPTFFATPPTPRRSISPSAISRNPRTPTESPVARSIEGGVISGRQRGHGSSPAAWAAADVR